MLQWAQTIGPTLESKNAQSASQMEIYIAVHGQLCLLPSETQSHYRAICERFIDIWRQCREY
jgi:hypothetical protein